jgi:hypothetical protein
MIKTAGILTIIPSIPSAVFVPYTEPAAGAVNGWIPKGENPLDQMRKFLIGLKLIEQEKKWPTKHVYHFDVELSPEELEILGVNK